MRLFDDEVQVAPENSEDLYPFLVRVTQEWEFLCNAQALEVIKVSEREMSAITDIRNQAISLFNSWVMDLYRNEWFRVFERFNTPSEVVMEKWSIALAAKEKLVVAHRCESVLAFAEKESRPLYDSLGGESALVESESIKLHCVLAPPLNDQFKVLPVSVVPSVKIFNH